MLSSIKFRALTDEERKLFFEALGEYGKDFQSIQQYMAQKGSQKSSGNNSGANAYSGSGNNHLSTNQAVSNNSTNNNGSARSSESNKSLDPQEKRELDKKEDDKKREQIRGFYNKVYAKLSELVGKIDDRVEKVNQELYLLINYGEIWKRHGFSENFSKPKRLLEELVYHGTTTYKFEKRNVRLRTPACKALKKINKIGVDEEVKVVTTRELPKEVTVELHPASNRDWLRVQSISQNPRVRARLSIQKRLTTILDYLENKWNISPDKLHRSVDVWLKVSGGSHPSNECGVGVTSNINQTNLPITNGNINHSNQLETTQASPLNLERLRLKPSNHHELKEVNITRVVPDYHLDLSLNAYMKRLEVTQPKCDQNSKELSKREPDLSDIHRDNCADQRGLYLASENIESSSYANKSRLPVSLTTPDCSILLEKSCTSDQPSIAQARKHLNILQSLTGTLEGCENSRTAYEDTQERSLMNMMLINQNSRSAISRGSVEPNLNELEQSAQQAMNHPTILINKDIPAFYDEDAALPVSSLAPQHMSHNETSSFGINTSCNGNHISNNHLNTDSQNSKSVDFQIPKNVTLGDFFKMSEPKPPSDNSVGALEPAGDDAANDAFPLSSVVDKMDEDCDAKDLDRESEEHFNGFLTKDNNGTANGQQVKLQNHMIEIKKFADGWTRQDEPSITLGELYLAFKCPEKIVLEYKFESAEPNLPQQIENLSNDEIRESQSQRLPNMTTSYPSDDPPNNSNLIYKLLTAASLSLAQIERRKQEQQNKMHEAQQSCSKMKRRKGSGQGQAMTLHDIEATNQRVEEALKQLQPIRLSSFKRTR